MVKGITVVGVSLHTVDDMSYTLFVCQFVSFIGWPLAAIGVTSMLNSRLVHIVKKKCIRKQLDMKLA
jgi:hypothetical protein